MSIDEKIAAIDARGKEAASVARAERAANPDIAPVFPTHKHEVKIEEHKTNEIVDAAEVALASLGSVYVRARS